MKNHIPGEKRCRFQEVKKLDDASRTEECQLHLSVGAPATERKIGSCARAHGARADFML